MNMPSSASLVWKAHHAIHSVMQHQPFCLCNPTPGTEPHIRLWDGLFYSRLTCWLINHHQVRRQADKPTQDLLVGYEWAERGWDLLALCHPLSSSDLPISYFSLLMTPSMAVSCTFSCLLLPRNIIQYLPTWSICLFQAYASYYAPHN